MCFVDYIVLKEESGLEKSWIMNKVLEINFKSCSAKEGHVFSDRYCVNSCNTLYMLDTTQRYSSQEKSL